MSVDAYICQTASRAVAHQSHPPVSSIHQVPYCRWDAETGRDDNNCDDVNVKTCWENFIFCWNTFFSVLASVKHQLACTINIFTCIHILTCNYFRNLMSRSSGVMPTLIIKLYPASWLLYVKKAYWHGVFITRCYALSVGQPLTQSADRLTIRMPWLPANFRRRANTFACTSLTTVNSSEGAPLLFEVC